MKCLLCNNNLEPYYVYDFITYKCYNCNQYYINSKHIDFFIQTFINNTIKCKSDRHKEILFDICGLKNKSYNYLNNDIKCKNIECRKKCFVYQFKYKNLIFRECNFASYYIIDLDNFKKYIDKNYKLSLYYFYKEIIFNKIKKLFVKG